MMALAAELGHAAAAAHGRISGIYLGLFGGLDAGLPVLAGSPATVGADSRYPLRHLAGHLCQAGHAADLHALLAAEHACDGDHAVSTWFAALNHAGTISGYLADIAIARSVSAAATDDALARGERATALGMELRYALMTASIASLTSGIPTGLLRLLVQAGVRSPGRALDHARRLTDPGQRSAALLAICDQVSADERPAALAQALTAATATADGNYLARALAGLAPYLPEGQRPAALARALTAATAITHGRYRARALAGLAPHLPPGLLAQALTSVPRTSLEALLAVLDRGRTFLPEARALRILACSATVSTARIEAPAPASSQRWQRTLLKPAGSRSSSKAPAQLPILTDGGLNPDAYGYSLAAVRPGRYEPTMPVAQTQSKPLPRCVITIFAWVSKTIPDPIDRINDHVLYFDIRLILQYNRSIAKSP